MNNDNDGKEFSAEVIPFNRNRNTEGPSAPEPTQAQAERLRNIPMSHNFEFYDIDGQLLVSEVGILNIGPDFAAVTDANNSIKLVVQANCYSYVKNTGPVAQVVVIQPDGGTTFIGQGDTNPSPEIA